MKNAAKCNKIDRVCHEMRNDIIKCLLINCPHTVVVI